MGVTAPIFDSSFADEKAGLLVAFLIGMCFGFFLEKGGLGNARKLAGQFYLTDMTVFKVMFSAIVTALLGLLFFSWIGFLDLSAIEYRQTYAVPYVVAGVLFGAGFVIGGLCPGTACVASATGRMDGLFVVAGVFSGIFLFGESFEFVHEFLFSTPLYQISIPAYVGSSYGVVTFVVVILAVGGFIGASKIEKRFSRTPNHVSARGTRSRSKLSVKFALVASLVSVIGLFAGDPYRTPYSVGEGKGVLFESIRAQAVSPIEVAKMMMSKASDFVLIDLRPSDQFDRYHLPSSLRYSDSLLLSGIGTSKKKIVFYDQGNELDERIARRIVDTLDAQFYYVDGGVNRWYGDVLFPNLNIPLGLSPEDIERISKRSRYFGGKPTIRKTGTNRGDKYVREGC